MQKFAKFSELELAGWQERAHDYDNTTNRMTGQTIPDLVAATGLISGQRVLDVCCGSAAVGQHLKNVGVDVVGVDFAPEMVRVARSNVPDGTFEVGNAESLPFVNGQFDGVTTNFGHYHLPDPEQAIYEAARVLKIGGRYGFTTWVGPQGSLGFKLILETITNNVDPLVSLPDAPDPFLLADPGHTKSVLKKAGFGNILITTYPSEIICKPNDFVGFLKAATVRATLVLKAQPKDTQTKIEYALRERIKEFTVGDFVHLPVPNRIVTATRTKQLVRH